MQLTEKEFDAFEDASYLICEYCNKGLGDDYKRCQTCPVLKILEVIDTIIPECEECGTNMEFCKDFTGDFQYKGKSCNLTNVEAWVCPNCKSVSCSIFEIRKIVKELTEE